MSGRTSTAGDLRSAIADGDLSAVDVDGAQQDRILRERHLGDVVEDHVDAVDRCFDDRTIADVAGDEADAVGSVVGVVEVEDPDLVTGVEQPTHEQRAEVAAPAGDERSGRAICVGTGHRSRP